MGARNVVDEPFSKDIVAQFLHRAIDEHRRAVGLRETNSVREIVETLFDRVLANLFFAYEEDPSHKKYLEDEYREEVTAETVRNVQ